MEESTSKTKSRINICNQRRLTIQHEIDENLRKQNYLSNLNSYKYQEQLFNRKINHLKQSLEHTEPYITDDIINDEESIMAPNCLPRIQNHFRLLNFSSDTEKRLLCQPASSNKSNKQISNQLRNISQKRNSNEIDQSIRRISFSQSRSQQKYSSRLPLNQQISNGNLFEQKTSQSYFNQQIFDEQKKQIENDQRKNFLLKEFDELKHTIDDPHATLSVLAALSRAILFLDSATE